MARRIPQVNQLIKKELAQIILREIEFPQNVLVTVTRVETSTDLNQAKIYVSSLPNTKTKEVLTILERNIYRLQQKLNQRLKMRPTPRIYFREETETAGAGKIEEILAKIKNTDKLDE